MNTKKSLSKKVFARFFISMAVILMVQTIILSFFLQPFYENRKTFQLRNNVRDIEKIYNDYTDGTITAVEAENSINQYSAVIGGHILIMDFVEKIKIPGNISPNEDLLALLLTTDQDSFTGKFDSDEIENGGITGQMLIYGQRLKGGEWIVVQIPLGSIAQSVSILKDFTLYLLTLSFGMALIMSIWASDRIAKPLIRLNNVAKELQKLNFKARYHGYGTDEIGNLGITFNLMSERLEKTISQLQDELEKEKALDLLRKEFIAQVSHELKTPISIIKGYVEALEDGIAETPESEKAYIDIIKTESIKMDTLIRELLDLTKLQTGNYKIEMEPFAVEDTVKNILTKYDKMLQDENKVVLFENGVGRTKVTADEFRIEQVITNLINNAIRYSDKSGTIIFKTEESYGKVLCTIFNPSEPIPEEQLAHVWDSFFKVNKSSSGTGLGLAITKVILDLHKSNYYMRNVGGGIETGFTLKIYNEGDLG